MAASEQAGDVIELLAERFERGGRTLGTHEDLDVHVEGALLGEQVGVELTHVGKRGAGGRRRAYGNVVALIEPSPHRRTPMCPHQQQCGGCPLMIASETFVAESKQQWLNELGIKVDRVVMGEHAQGYRWSSKRVASRAGGTFSLGSYRAGTHEVADMRGCLVDHPNIAAAFDEIEAAGGCEGLRYVWAKTNGEGAVLVTLVLESEDANPTDLVDKLTLPAGIAACVQVSRGNAMRGSSVRHLRGVEEIAVELCGVRVAVGPLGFLQPNPAVAALAYKDLVGVGNGELALDLYAGAGVTTHLLRGRYTDVRACESSHESARALGVVPQTAETFLASQRVSPQLVVANPPRAGLGPSVCEALVSMALRAEGDMALHIMSCEPRALARDLERLREAGVFELIGARAYDTLPQTAHVEVIAWLRRKLPT